MGEGVGNENERPAGGGETLYNDILSSGLFNRFKKGPKLPSVSYYDFVTLHAAAQAWHAAR